ncbi:sulfite exporter TauE/SafE family protein [Radiobacillus kanasensis]|uniref:sulfite exporter TauE/SafE family protein n=1 Tax=Radiobacillus kanasensis TaxID=2844358 RepID=UPI001E41C63E|nr:sulfite exporter TauE/SafE family protein [Radiobacillus kanasensis]UFT98241.1 sulfite exporter TauE/SafE family protein [Radiobacillus kanasensis]
MVFLLSLFIGFLAAFIGSLVGLGGGTILIPSLLLLNQYVDAYKWATPQAVVGLSLIVMVFTAGSSSYSYIKNKRVDVKSGFIFLAGVVPGGILGAWINQFFGDDKFSLYFGILMFVTFGLMSLKNKEKNVREKAESKWIVHTSKKLGEETYIYSYPWLLAILITFIVGMISGAFGIGGGSMLVPAMMLLFGFPSHVATATSMFLILFLSMGSTIAHGVLGHIPWQYVAFFIPGSLLGGLTGAAVNQRIKGQTVELILRIVLLIIGVRLIWQAIG